MPGMIASPIRTRPDGLGTIDGVTNSPNAVAHMDQMLREIEVQLTSVETPVRPLSSPELSHARILVIDDEPLNIRVVQKYLREFGYHQVSGVTDPLFAMEAIHTQRPDVVLLDVMMPQISGYEVLRLIRQDSQWAHLPVLILTASCDRETRVAVLELGATDFLSKPIDPSELKPRVRNALIAKNYHDSITEYARTLEQRVRQRTIDLEVSRRELVHCLARAGEFRDTDTGHHVMRVGRFAGLIARAMGHDNEYVDMLEQAAQLHDIGKIAIPDEILRHPGKLSPEEFEHMQKHALFGKKIIQSLAPPDADVLRRHTLAGQSILDTSKSPLIQMASRIAVTHHERWDGTGYPLGLAGDDIPLEGRITAVADVFDALASKRPYKPAFPFEKCCQIVFDDSGKHFDPRVVEAFAAQRQIIAEVQIAFADPE